VRTGFSIAERFAYSANIFLNIKTFFLHDVIPEMPSFSMRPAKYFYDKPLPIYLDPKTVLNYLPHPVLRRCLLQPYVTFTRKIQYKFVELNFYAFKNFLVEY
jgi:hypothetical protein